MHIPDGYLSPETTIPVMAAMVPVWGIAAKKVKEKVGEKNLPTLSLGAAFSFTVMMMNVPVAGGSSVHAVGAVLIAILLGPWAATVAVSAALLIQALVFGDGGILSFGANCLNMAFVMPFTGYYVYKIILGRNSFSRIDGKSNRRSLIAAFAGGFIGINTAAFFAAVEFGIQPILFTGADGAALYCPYPLWVTIPAMMITHLAVAGPVEGMITAAAVAYIAKAAPGLFINSALKETKTETNYKSLFILLGILVMLTPLGLLAQGTAWGEWGTQEIKDTLGFVPQGMSKASDLWHSLMPDYSLPTGSWFATSSYQSINIIGYVLSAIIGIVLIVALLSILMKLLTRSGHKGFLARTLQAFADLFENELYNERFSGNGRLLQRLDPRVKIIVFLSFMVYVNFAQSLMLLPALALTAICYAWISGLPLKNYVRRTWMYLPVIVLIFSLPGASSLLTPGVPAFYMPWSSPDSGGLYFSTAGLAMSLRVALRTGTVMSFAFLMLMTTRWSDITLGLRRLHIPEIFVSILNMTYRYLFLLAETGTQMINGRQMRTVGKIKGAEDRKFISGRAGQLFIRVHSLSEDIYNAMKLRGGDGTIPSMKTLKFKHGDVLFLLFNVTLILLFIIGGHIL